MVPPRFLGWSSSRLKPLTSPTRPARLTRGVSTLRMMQLTRSCDADLGDFLFENPRFFHFRVGVLGCWEGPQGVAKSRRRPEVVAAYQDSGRMHC